MVFTQNFFKNDDNVNAELFIENNLKDFTDFNIPLFSSDDINNVHFKAFHLNIRSLNKNGNELLVFINSLALDFDIIVLSEIWTFNLDLFTYLFENYKFDYVSDPGNKASGVAVFY